ncbi:hypothetical protein OUZ56_033330 [Daphnia magna]|uniref:Uncharacterized protein n=1 Tax=Daphnia magna TaxID=35525 RepID=A0ABR0BAN4_9CRUS|nr:hypothetical protein OUZ56_033330 [Daphnia magna]
MVSQCIHIEYKSKTHEYNSVFTLNTKVKLIEYKYNSVFTLNTINGAAPSCVTPKFFKYKLII